ncbi:MAG: RNA methyltransferase [Dehalococcoidia bacterium]|nr:RNA methyltransferase [Dehalococcoidia bacterium]
MAYDEILATRIRDAIGSRPDITERKMFGGLAFMAGGNMFCGITRDDLMVRVGPRDQEAALARPGAKPMDFNGRPMTGMIFVEPSGVTSDTDLQSWIDLGYGFVMTLPPKAQAKPKRRNTTS